MKILKRLGFIVISLVLIFSAGIYLFLRHSLPPLDGELRLNGLSQKVSVTRDAYGIPHIKAENKLDALRALGFVVASERLFQMELSRRLTYGRLSEVFGAAALPTDKLYRSLQLKQTAEKMISHGKNQGPMDTTTPAEMQAYFDGVNEYLRTRPLPYEFTLLNFKPEEFKPLDAYVMIGHMASMFGIALKADPLMTELAKLSPLDQFQVLRNDALKTPFRLVTTEQTRQTLQASLDLFHLPFFEGSNSWLVAPSRSTSGKSIFANDPHIGFSSPAVWFEAHIQTPQFELYGHYLPLVPFAILGHSRHHAWGFTMSLTDDQDLYKEDINRTNKTLVYQGQSQRYQEYQEIIKVKNEQDTVLTMIQTPHGPLMDHVLDGRPYSLKWAYHQVDNDLMKTLRLLGEARQMKDFEEPLKTVNAPGLNVMYADAKNIAWWTVGQMAIRKNPNSDMIFDGASGADEYLGVVPWHKKPHSVNPPHGIIVTANSRPATLDSEVHGDWQADDRFQTITELLSKKQTWSAEDFKALQTLNYNSINNEIRRVLTENIQLSPEDQKRYDHHLTSLKQWDLKSEIGSTDASLFYLWCNAMVRQILKDIPATHRDTYLGTAYPWSFFKRVIFDKNSPWWQKESRQDAITASFLEIMQRYPQIPRWGQIHTLEFYHPLGRLKPLDKIFNLGPYPAPGGFNEINNNKSWPFGGDEFLVTAGPSTRRIVDLAQSQKSWGINPIGMSGHILSPFHHDQVPLFLKGQYREQWMDEADIQANKTHRLELVPLYD